MATDSAATPAPPADTRPARTRPGRRARQWRNLGWYTLLSTLSMIILFPVWMTLVRSLSAPLTYVTRGQPPYPVEPEWDVFSRAFIRGRPGPPPAGLSAG